MLFQEGIDRDRLIKNDGVIDNDQIFVVRNIRGARKLRSDALEFWFACARINRDVQNTTTRDLDIIKRDPRSNTRRELLCPRVIYLPSVRHT